MCIILITQNNTKVDMCYFEDSIAIMSAESASEKLPLQERELVSDNYVLALSTRVSLHKKEYRYLGSYADKEIVEKIYSSIRTQIDKIHKSDLTKDYALRIPAKVYLSKLSLLGMADPDNEMPILTLASME